MTRQQTTQSREGACSLLGECFVRLVGGSLQGKPIVPVIGLFAFGARRECEVSLPRPFPLSKINNPSRVTSLAATWAAALSSQTSLGRRPFFFIFSDRLEKALQSLVQRLWFFHCAFSNALNLLPRSETIQSDRGTKSCKRITKIWGGKK